MKFLSDILIKAGLVVEGSAQLNSLAGVGSRMVTVGSSGVLSTQSLPTANITGGGTAGQVTYFDASNNIVSDNGLNYDSANGRLSIGGTSNSYKLNVLGVPDGTIGQVILATTGRLNIYAYHSAQYGVILESKNPNDVGSLPITLSGSTVNLLGTPILSSLIGAGTRMVVTDASGTLSTQAIPTSSVVSVFGRSGTVTAQSGDYTTAQVTESGNLYYTDARSRAAISVAGSGSYNPATGVITINGGVTSVNGATGAVTLTTANIGEVTNLYYTDARARAAISVTGSGSYNSTTGVITINGGVTSVNGLTGAVTLTTSNISEGTNLYYTDARARAAISLTTTGSSGAATYSAGVLNIPNYTLAGLGGVGGTIATGQVAYATAANTIGGSNNLFWDAANSRLGIGTNAPNSKLSVITSGGPNFIVSQGFGDVSTQSGYISVSKGRGSLSSPAALLSGDVLGSINFGGYFTSSSIATAFAITAIASSDYTALANPVNLVFRKFDTTANSTELMRLYGSTGNLAIGGTFVSDNGQRLQVYGDTLLRGSGATSATTALTVQNSSSTNLFTVRNDGLSTFSGIVVAGSATSTQGSVILRGYYTSGYLATIGTDASSGGPMISYAVESAQNSTAGSFVSSTPNVDTPRSAYTVSGSHRWYTAAASTTAVGTSIALTKYMELYNSGNLVLGGGVDDATNRLQVGGRAIISSTLTHQLEVANPSGGRLLITAQATANSFTLLDSQGYGFTHGTSSSGINARQTNINLWTQAADTTILNLGGQDVNPTVARTRTFVQPVSSAITAFAPTSGTAVDYFFRTAGNSNFAPTSGNATYTQVQFSPSINQTGGANGVTRGLYVNPTLTNAADWRSIQWDNNSGWGLYGLGTAKNYLNGTTLIGTASDDGINKLQVAGSIKSAGIIRSDASRTAAVNDVSIALLGSNITTYAAGFTMAGLGYGLNAIYAQHEQRFGGDATFNEANLNGGGLILNKLAPTAAGTVTMSQVGSGRTMSNLHLMTQFSGNNNLTVTHMSGLHIYGHYRTSGSGTLTVSGAYYGILLTDPNEFGGGATVTGDNWGFYQAGAAPINYFGGRVNIGTTVTTGNYKLRIAGLPTSATGLAAGDVWNNGGVLNIV